MGYQAGLDIETPEIKAVKEAKVYELEQKTVQELQREVRETGERKSWIATAQKKDLIAFLVEGKRPSHYTIPAEVQEVQMQAPADIQDALKVLAGYFTQGQKAPSIDREAIIDMIEEYSTKKVQVLVQQPDQTFKKIEGLTHYIFSDLCLMVSLKLNIYLVGAPGGGKTHICAQVAEALGLDFYAIPVGPQTSKSDLIGYTDGRGEIVITLMRKCYEFGGLMLIDEIDAGNPAVLTVMNSLLSNSVVGFPDGMIAKNEKCHFIVSGNTSGLGNDSNFTTRVKLDPASLDRFVELRMDYDVNLERARCGLPLNNEDLNIPNQVVPRKKNHENDLGLERLFNKILRMRARVAELREKIIISPRTTYNATIMYWAGFDIEKILQCCVYKGISNSQKSAISAV